MNSNDEQRLVRKIAEMAQSLGQIAKCLEACNKNFLEYAKIIQSQMGQDVDLDELDKNLQPCKLEVGQRVCNMDKSSVLYLHEGIIDRITVDGAFVKYDGIERPVRTPRDKRQHLGVLDDDLNYDNHVCGGPEYCVVCRDREKYVRDANQMELPALIDDAKIGPMKYVADPQGRMLPSEWRHNLGMDVFKPEGPGHEEHERQLMTEEAFRIYNSGLFTSGVVDQLKKSE